MILPPPTRDIPAVTLPTLAVRLGVSIWAMESLLARRPDLAERLFRIGGYRCAMAVDLPLFRDALAAPTPTPPILET